jgi:hypothetical protein
MHRVEFDLAMTLAVFGTATVVIVVTWWTVHRIFDR